MIIVTGGAGFIGSALVSRLNELGRDDILIVDELEDSPKWKNLLGKRYRDYLHKEDFLKALRSDALSGVETVYHMGACSSTTELNMDFLMENNYRYSRAIAEWCQTKNVRLVYASSAATYGDGSAGFSDEKFDELRPLNPYGYSKHIFDLWLIREKLHRSCVGLKFFNVFGPNEYHKGDMASVVYKAFHQIQASGEVRLFKSYRPEYADGEQVRDFVYIKDCVDIMIGLAANKHLNGIFNLGTGRARTWKDLVKAIFSALGKPEKIIFIDMPETIRNAYQYYTCAEMEKLASAVHDLRFQTLEESITDYVQNYLAPQRHL